MGLRFSPFHIFCIGPNEISESGQIDLCTCAVNLQIAILSPQNALPLGSAEVLGYTEQTACTKKELNQDLGKRLISFYQ